jgi:hypothetical protein
MRFSIIAAALPALFVGNVALAQMNGMVVPTPGIGATSPLGSASSSSSVSPTGIPFGSTEITSAGVSPLPPNPTGSLAVPSGGTPCSTLGASSSQMYGSTATYDGGGLSVANSTPATGAASGSTAASPSTSSGISTASGMSTTSGMTQSASGTMDTAGMSGMCGSGSGSLMASSTPTSATAPGGNARTGIPFGSIELGNLGVSAGATVPGPVSTITPNSNLTAPPIPSVPVVTSPPPLPPLPVLPGAK